MPKKKFKDTKLGGWLSKNGPKVLDMVGDFLPPVKVITELTKNEGWNFQDKKEFELLLQDYEKEIYALEVEDRKSAREREVNLGRYDPMMIITGIIGLASFVFILYALVFLDIPESNSTLFYHLVGIVEGVTLSIIYYYYGTSKSSSDKTKILSNGTN